MEATNDENKRNEAMELNEEEDLDVKHYSSEKFEELQNEDCSITTNETSTSAQPQSQELATQEHDTQVLGEQPVDPYEGQGADLLEMQEVQPIADEQVNQQGQPGGQEPQQTGNAGFPRDYLFALVNSISSTNLLSEESIDVLRELLCPPQAVFDSISLKDMSQGTKILEGIIKEKSISANNALGNALSYYHKSLMDSQIHHLDKFIRIIKSKRREMHLQTIKPKTANPDTVAETLETMHNLADTSTINKENNNINQNPLDIIGLLDHNRLGAMVVKKQVIPQYNPSDKSITIRVNEKYEVKMKILNDIVTTHKSRIDCIPQHILQTHIFPYLTSYELFAMRAVSNEWRELIRGMWHVIFKREMLEQVVAADICNDIEMHFKLLQIRTPFYQKFGVFMKAITEMIEWSLLEEAIRNNDLCKNRKMLLITLLKLLGYKIDLQRLWDFQESDWDGAKDVTAIELRAAMNKVLQTEFVFDSNAELQQVKKYFLDVPDMSTSQFKDFADKNWLLISIFLRQMYVFGLLRNNILISQKYATMAKDKLKDISNGWTHKKGFLEGAYKILLFRYVKFINGQIIVPKDEEEEEEAVYAQGVKEEVITNNFALHEARMEEAQQQQAAIIEQVTQEGPVDDSKTQEAVSLAETPIINNETSNSDLITTSLQEASAKESENRLEKGLEISESVLSDNDTSLLREKVSNMDLQEFEEIKRFYSQDIEASLDALVKKFTENAKVNKTGKKLEPDYIIKKNGTETHIFLDDETRLEVLIQKFLKFHLLIMRLNCQIKSHISTVPV